jgi:hypothetical protein
MTSRMVRTGKVSMVNINVKRAVVDVGGEMIKEGYRGIAVSIRRRKSRRKSRSETRSNSSSCFRSWMKDCGW